MPERHNTIVCSFDPASPRINAYDIHGWIYTSLRIPENDVQLIQIDGARWQVFIKLTDSEKVHAVLRDTEDKVEYKYPTEEISLVSIALAGMGTKRVTVASLPPEVPNEALRVSLAPYVEVLDIQGGKWSMVYRYPVANDIRQVTLTITKHALSHLTVAGHRVLSYEDSRPLDTDVERKAISSRDVLPAGNRERRGHSNATLICSCSISGRRAGRAATTGHAMFSRATGDARECRRFDEVTACPPP
jgi:hypothetical protein